MPSDYLTFGKYLDNKEEQHKAEKDAIYKERNLCVALIADLARSLAVPVWIAEHQGKEFDPEWRNVLFVDLPGVGQISWHVHESELKHFRYIPRNSVKAYDGHTTEEKYNRIKEYVNIW